MTISTNDWRKIEDTVRSVLSSDYWLASDTEIDTAINDILIGLRQRNLNIEVGNHSVDVVYAASLALTDKPKKLNPTAKLTEQNVRDIRSSTTESTASLARKFNISDAAIVKARRGETYKNIEAE